MKYLLILTLVLICCVETPTTTTDPEDGYIFNVNDSLYLYGYSNIFYVNDEIYSHIGEGHENTDEYCSDEIDNDNDGVTDCEDVGCRRANACIVEYKASESFYSGCQDDYDNDGDNFIDCADTDCLVFTTICPKLIVPRDTILIRDTVIVTENVCKKTAMETLALEQCLDSRMKCSFIACGYVDGCTKGRCWDTFQCHLYD